MGEWHPGFCNQLTQAIRVVGDDAVGSHVYKTVHPIRFIDGPYLYLEVRGMSMLYPGGRDIPGVW